MTNRGSIRKRGESPLFFIQPPTPLDISIITNQMEKRNFSSGIVYGVAARCKWGFPRVIACKPIYRLKPFPTTFWLTCPYLVKKCGELESHGGVGALETFMLSRKAAWKNYNLDLRLLRLSLLSSPEKIFLRRYMKPKWISLQRNLMGGIREEEKPTMKCLHLQVGAWLATEYHPGQEWLEEHVTCLDCDDPSSFPCVRCSRNGGNI